MIFNRLWTIAIVLVISSSTLLSAPLHADPIGCGDFLEYSQQKPEGLKFISCMDGKDSQLRVLKSTYGVPGKSAKAVEQFLIEKFAMPQLRFVCCGWEPLGGRGFFKYKGYTVGVNMYSAESLITDNDKWADIPEFTVETTLYLEEP